MINNKSRSGQAFWLGLGNLVSFSFGIISAAILSRILSVTEYGTYRQVLYVYGTLLTVFSLGLPRAYSFFLARIPIEQGKKSVEKMNYLFLLLGIIFAGLLYFGSGIIGDLLSNPNLSSCLRYFSMTPIFLLPLLGLESIMATYKKSFYATVYIILSRLFNLICVVVPVLIWGGANRAVLGLTFSSGLCFIIGIYLERKPFNNVRSEPSDLSLKTVFKYSLPLLVASLWGIATKSMPQFFISRWYGTEAFAEFANGFIELPVAAMVISAIATVLLPEISALAKIENHQKIIEVWRSAFEKSAMIIYPLSVFACVFAKDIMIFLFGHKYEGSTFYFQIIIVYNLLRVVPYAPIMMGLNLGRQYAIASMLPTIFVFVLDLIWVNIFDGAHGVAIIQCLAMFVHIGTMFFFINKKLKIRYKDLLPIKLCSLIITQSAICSLIIHVLINVFIPNLLSGWLVVIAGTVFVPLYLCFCKITNINYKQLINFISSQRKRGHNVQI